MKSAPDDDGDELTEQLFFSEKSTLKVKSLIFRGNCKEMKYLSRSIVSAVENIISSLQQKLIGCGLKRWDLEFIIYCSSSIGAVLSSDVAGYPWQNMPRLSEQLRILAQPATLRDLNNQWSIFSSLAQTPDTQLCWLRDSDHQNIQFRKIQRKRGTFSQGCLQNCFKSCVWKIFHIIHLNPLQTFVSGLLCLPPRLVFNMFYNWCSINTVTHSRTIRSDPEFWQWWGEAMGRVEDDKIVAHAEDKIQT